MITADKLVCYLESYPEKYNRFEQEILSADEYASNINDVIEFIKRIENNIDINRKNRKKVQRIKDDIVQLIS